VLGYQAAPAKLVDSTPTNELHMQRVGLLGISIRPAVRLASGRAKGLADRRPVGGAGGSGIALYIHVATFAVTFA
jgi:hypothetical protein